VADSGVQPSAEEVVPLADFLRERKSEVLAWWLRAMRECAPAARLSDEELEDHLPVHLEQTADAVEAIATHDWASVQTDGARRHAVTRLAAGFELDELMTELFLLRHVLFELLARHRPPERMLAEAQVVGWAIDASIRDSIRAFMHEKERTLQALDRVSALALESRSLDALLNGLIRVVLESASAVCTSALLLLEGDRLRVRAAAGLEEPELDLSLRMGEGFSGRIAQDRRPAALRAAAQDPVVRSRVIHERGVRALYGVPLISRGELIGVLHMGSVTTAEFSEGDKTLLRAIADRAAAAIVEHRLREAAELLARKRDEALGLLSSIYATAPIGLAAFDRELRLTGINTMLAELGGLSPEAYLGRRLVEVLPGQRYAREIEEGLRRVLETGGPLLNVEVSGYAAAAPGKLRHWIASYYPVRTDGGLEGLGAIVQDVTERKQAEDFQRHVFGIVSHDLRGPLSVVTLSANMLLRSEEITERQAKILARVSSSAARMEAIVRDLLDYSQARSGKGVPVQRRPMDLAGLCRLVVDEVEASAPRRRFRWEGPEPLEGEWDPDRLAQVLANLVRNAATYSPPDTEVVVRWSAADRDATIEVLNEGPTIPPELLVCIFEPFQRGAAGETGTQRGLGLGLFIAREIVRAHQGEISASSSGGKTVFRVRLPRWAGR
jgi:PAS domain S-box-containing protein